MKSAGAKTIVPVELALLLCVFVPTTTVALPGLCGLDLNEIFYSPLASIEPNPVSVGSMVMVKLGLSDETGLSTEWYEAFLQHCDTGFRIQPLNVTWSSDKVPNDRWKFEFKIPAKAPVGPYIFKWKITDPAGNIACPSSILIHHMGGDVPMQDLEGLSGTDILVVKSKASERHAPLDAVRNIQGIQGYDEAFLKWDPPPNVSVAGYHIFEGPWKDSKQITKGLRLRPDYIVGLSTSGPRDLRVVAVDTMGRIGSVIAAPVIRVGRKNVPPPPKDLRVVEKRRKVVRIEWSHDAPLVRSYRVYRSYMGLDGKQTPRVFIARTHDQIFQDRWLILSTTYTYTVTALNALRLESEHSEPLLVYEPDQGLRPGQRVDVSTAVAAEEISAPKMESVGPYEYIKNRNYGEERLLFFVDINNDNSPDIFIATQSTRSGYLSDADGPFNIFLRQGDDYKYIGLPPFRYQEFEILASSHNGVNDILTYQRSGPGSGILTTYIYDRNAYAKYMVEQTAKPYFAVIRSIAYPSTYVGHRQWPPGEEAASLNLDDESKDFGCFNFHHKLAREEMAHFRKGDFTKAFLMSGNVAAELNKPCQIHSPPGFTLQTNSRDIEYPEAAILYKKARRYLSWRSPEPFGGLTVWEVDRSIDTLEYVASKYPNYYRRAELEYELGELYAYRYGWLRSRNYQFHGGKQRERELFEEHKPKMIEHYEKCIETSTAPLFAQKARLTLAEKLFRNSTDYALIIQLGRDHINVIDKGGPDGRDGRSGGIHLARLFLAQSLAMAGDYKNALIEFKKLSQLERGETTEGIEFMHSGRIEFDQEVQLRFLILQQYFENHDKKIEFFPTDFRIGGNP